MNKLIAVLAMPLLILSLLFAGCSTTDRQVVLVTFAPQPSVPEETSPAETAVPDNLSIMAENETVFGSGMAKWSPGFEKDDISEIEAISVAIVKATAITSSPHPDLDEDECISLTTIRIDEVIKSDGSLKVGAEKILVEYYRLEEREGKILVFTNDDSIPMQKNEQYLLFLQESPQNFGDYAFAGAWQGKYPITEKTLTQNAAELTREELELCYERFNDMTINLAQQAFDKYLR